MLENPFVDGAVSFASSLPSWKAHRDAFRDRPLPFYCMASLDTPTSNSPCGPLPQSAALGELETRSAVPEWRVVCRLTLAAANVRLSYKVKSPRARSRVSLTG